MSGLSPLNDRLGVVSLPGVRVSSYGSPLDGPNGYRDCMENISPFWRSLNSIKENLDAVLFPFEEKRQLNPFECVWKHSANMLCRKAVARSRSSASI